MIVSKTSVFAKILNTTAHVRNAELTGCLKVRRRLYVKGNK
jgi:hypothetical protein